MWQESFGKCKQLFCCSSLCHPERSEGPGVMSTEILRGVYPERSEWAQHDRTGCDWETSLSASIRPNLSCMPRLPEGRGWLGRCGEGLHGRPWVGISPFIDESA